MFGKIITAVVTPFDELKNIDYESFKKILLHLSKTHTDSVVIAGTTGEGPTLSINEKINLFKLAKDVLPKHIKVIASIGSNNTAETIKIVKRINKINVDGYLIITPYYNKPSQEGIYQHFKAIDTVSNKPIIIYNCCDFYDNIMFQLDKMYDEKFTSITDDGCFYVCSNYEQAIKYLNNYWFI